MRRLTKQLYASASHYAPEKVYLHFDRLLVSPGEAIWFNAYLRDANTFQPSSTSDLIYVELIAPNGGVLKTLSLIAKMVA